MKKNSDESGNFPNNDNYSSGAQPENASDEHVQRIISERGQSVEISNETPVPREKMPYGVQLAQTPAEIAEKELALKALKASVTNAKRAGASQKEIADMVLDAMGIIYGPNPFDRNSKPMAGWGGK